MISMANLLALRRVALALSLMLSVPAFAETSEPVRPAPIPAEATALLESVAKIPRGSQLGDLELDEKAPCLGIPTDGFPQVTNKRFYFLSEVGGCGNLRCFLQQVVSNGHHANATLVIDQACVLGQPLEIPARMTIAGVGIGGESILTFEKLKLGTSAIRVEPVLFGTGISNTTIRDLTINYIGNPGAIVGVDVTEGNIVHLERVTVKDFDIGLYGENAYSIFISNSNISDNGFNILLGKEAYHWRVRDNVLKSATFFSVWVSGGNDHMFAGNRFENSSYGAVSLGTYGSMLFGNRFESNGPNPLLGFHVGVYARPDAESTRIVSNIFSSDEIFNEGTDTRCRLNIGPQLSCQ